MRARGRGALVLFGVLLFASLFATIPTTAQEPSAGVMQADDPRNLTFDQNRMYMYGQSTAESQSTWQAWTHSATTDPESDDQMSEGNYPGDANNGGGPRTYTFEGSNPVAEPVAIDNTIPVTGNIHLLIICDLEQNACTKEITVVLRLGNRDLAQQTINQPDEDENYQFEFFINQEEIEADETFGLRVSFQKPQSVNPNDGYILYLGNGESWMDIPVLPPYEPVVPGLDGSEYVSPYAQASGYNLESSNSVSFLGLVFWGALGIAVFVAGFMFLPPIPMKELSILFTGLGLLVSMMVAPIIAGPLQMGKINPDDPDVWSIEELVKLDERSGTFLGDTFVEDYEFSIYVEYDDVYITSDRGEKISGLGYEEYSSLFEDPEVPQRGKEYVQLYFSLFHIDLRPGQAVLVNSMIVNSTDPATGQSSLVPLHACMDCVNPDTGANWETKKVTVTINGENSDRYAIQHVLCEIIGEDSSWGVYAHIMTALGILMGGIGFWMSFRENRQYDDEGEEEPDEDFEDALDDLEEF
jgi:hypothetical protein